MRASARAAGVLAGVALAAVVSGGPAAATGLARLTAATTSDLYVAVVVDFGGASGAPKNFATCVKVPQGGTDADALAAAVGQDNVGYAPSGLLCSIDGVPQSGVANCNASSGNEYFFWSYWNGTSGSWSYAPKGPASTLVTPGDVEGWRFQDPGPASPSAPTPATAADFSRICPSEYAESSTASTTTTAAVPPVGHAGVTTTTSGAAVSPAPSNGSHDTTATTVPSKATGGTKGHATTTVPPRSTGGTDPATTTVPAPAHGGGSARALGAVPHPKPADTDWVVPTVVAVLVLALGGAAAYRWRRRPHVP